MHASRNSPRPAKRAAACRQPASATSPPLDDSRWLVTTRGGDTYLNEVSRGCFGAASPFSYIEYRVPGGQLCRGEIIRVVDQSAQTVRGACGLGEYQRLEPVSSETADTGA